MKQSKFKTLGIVLSGILLFSTGIQASSMISKVNATLDKSMSMTWNNQQFKPTERDGSVVHPILYNDRTYLPVKFIAEKAGIQVEWDSKTKTVGLTQYERPIVNTSPKVDTYEKKYNDAINTNKELEKKIERLERDYKNAKNNVTNLQEELGELDIAANAQDRIDREEKNREEENRQTKGKLYYRGGNLKYEGDIKNGKSHGYGIEYYEDGSISSEGNWKDGKRHGFSINYVRGKLFYVGEYVNGNREGLGAHFENGKFKYEAISKKNQIVEVVSRNLHDTRTPSLEVIISGMGDSELTQDRPVQDNSNGGWYINEKGEQVWKEY